MSREEDRHFARQWLKTNKVESEKEEANRYSWMPYNYRIVKFLKIRGYLSNTDNDSDASDT